MTGSLAFAVDVQSGTEHDLLVMDGIAFPVALLVLGLVLRSIRLILIPIFNMLVSILTAFTIALPIAHHMTFVSYAPSLMMSITIAMVGLPPSMPRTHRRSQSTTRCSHCRATRRSCVPATACWPRWCR